MKDNYDDRSKKFNDLEDKIKKLIKKEMPDSCWLFLLADNGELIQGNGLKDMEDAEDVGFMVSHSHSAREAIIIGSLGVKCILLNASGSDREKAMKVITGLIDADVDGIKPMREPSQSKGLINEIGKSESIKSYLKNRLKNKKD